MDESQRLLPSSMITSSQGSYLSEPDYLTGCCSKSFDIKINIITRRGRGIVSLVIRVRVACGVGRVILLGLIGVHWLLLLLG